MIKREVIIGDARLLLGDCMDILPTLDKVDAVITDPPYGIGVDRSMAKASGTKYGVAAAAKGVYESSGWDDQPIDATQIAAMLALAGEAIIFGGNYFALPPSRCWLVWDKKVNGAFADCELAWTNLDKQVRRIEWMWNGMLRQGGEVRNGHPTQKPLEVMKWCIEQATNPHTILDPFMGSGTTGVAAIQLGRKFIGIEREEKYFDIAVSRIQQAVAQGQLFAPEPAKQIQGALL